LLCDYDNILGFATNDDVPCLLVQKIGIKCRLKVRGSNIVSLIKENM